MLPPSSSDTNTCHRSYGTNIDPEITRRRWNRGASYEGYIIRKAVWVPSNDVILFSKALAGNEKGTDRQTQKHTKSKRLPYSMRVVCLPKMLGISLLPREHFKFQYTIGVLPQNLCTSDFAWVFDERLFNRNCAFMIVQKILLMFTGRAWNGHISSQYVMMSIFLSSSTENREKRKVFTRALWPRLNLRDHHKLKSTCALVLMIESSEYFDSLPALMMCYWQWSPKKIHGSMSMFQIVHIHQKAKNSKRVCTFSEHSSCTDESVQWHMFLVSHTNYCAREVSLHMS